MEIVTSRLRLRETGSASISFAHKCAGSDVRVIEVEMHEELDGEFVLFAAAALSRDLMKSPNPANEKDIKEFKDLLLYAQKALMNGLSDDDQDETRELIEELFLQGMRDQPTVTRATIDAVFNKSFAVARALQVS
jgi:hypothetical protein